ncbi:MAG TPA: thioredoxin family protein [Levilinea sp.]|nr:thioredoxin family protein [Levilinea sp.]
MPNVLDEKIRKQISEIFSSLQRPVGILFFEDDDCEYCEQTRALLSEVSALSDRIRLTAYTINEDPGFSDRYGISQAPGTVIGGMKGDEFIDYGIRFMGIPAGHEFTSLIRTILMVSAGDSGLSSETRNFLASLDRPVRLQVFVTPTCPYCPQAVVLAHQMAFQSDMVEAEMVEATEFIDLSDQYGVSGVPHTVINEGAGELIGAAPEAVLREKIREIIEDEL